MLNKSTSLALVFQTARDIPIIYLGSISAQNTFSLSNKSTIFMAMNLHVTIIWNKVCALERKWKQGRVMLNCLSTNTIFFQVSQANKQKAI